MIRKNTVPLEQVLPYIGREPRIEIDGESVGLSSVRMLCFKESGIKCVTCGLEGRFFAVEKSSDKDTVYHLNLYALDENGAEVLMTHDHIIPRSKGGPNIISNTQTMCAPCNFSKGNGGHHGGNEKNMMRQIKTGIERIDSLLRAITSKVKSTGKLAPADLNDLIRYVSKSMVNSIVPKALNPVGIKQKFEDFDQFHTEVIRVASNVSIAKTPGDVCDQFIVLNHSTGERLSINFKHGKP